MTLSFPNKDPSENLVYGFDFSALLDAGETLTTAVVTASPAGLTIVGGADLASAPIVRQRISGGTAQIEYLLICRVTTNQGNTRVLSAAVGVVVGA